MDQDEPQEPKPTTDGKQTVGHSYSTRSKFKRASLSDDGSSGAQDKQPLLKKKTRLGAKSAGKSVKIENTDPTPDSNAVEPNTVDERAPAKVALQNDLVLESLLRYMNQSDLLSCRIVNKQWQDEATKELRRRKLVIRFSFLGKENQLVFLDVCRRLRRCRTPSLLSSFQVKTNCWNDLGSAGVTSFFTAVGKQMKNLTLHLNYLGQMSSFKESSLMTHLQNLLFRQAPNLEFLEVKFRFPPHWESELETLDVFCHGSLLLPNLQTFIVRGTPAPTKFVSDVINAAVNLRSLEGDWSACMKYLLGAEGRAKIHLLKSLNFEVMKVQSRRRSIKFDLEVVKSFLAKHNQHLKLETFECVSEALLQGASFVRKIVGVIYPMLECSSGSLQKLRIEPADWFKNRLIIPRLPQLKEICFDCFWRYVGYCGGGFFPRGFNMNHSFPKLSSIVLLRCTADTFRQFVIRIGKEITEPVPSIRYIIWNDSRKKANIVPSVATVTEFRHVFPNLKSVSHVNNENYYEI